MKALWDPKVMWLKGVLFLIIAVTSTGLIWEERRKMPVLRRWRGFVLLFLLATVAICVLTTPGGPEPVFEGRPVSDWLNAGYEDASRVLHEVGPAAMPALFAKLRREHPQYGYWKRYRSAWEKSPSVVRRLLPRPRTVCFDEWRACNALVAIGPRAIPSLGLALSDSSFLVRSTSAQALFLFGQRGLNIDRAVPALRAALHDDSPVVRRYSATALAATRARQD